MSRWLDQFKNHAFWAEWNALKAIFTHITGEKQTREERLYQMKRGRI